MKFIQVLKKLFPSRINQNYVSDIDKFLKNYDATHPVHFSVEIEKQKHARIAYLRDHAVKTDINQIIWKDF